MNRKLKPGLGPVILVLAVYAAGALADEPAATPARPANSAEVGASTTALLELQRSGLAAGKLQPISGEVASRSYQRYLESFSQPIPNIRDNGAAAASPAVGASSGSTASPR
ncbi:MAG: DUF3613 domain-containing protein [Bacteroidota bacterium]